MPDEYEDEYELFHVVKPSLLIVLDYDETYTADASLWDTFIFAAKMRGHIVVCCTYRLGTMDNWDVERDMGKHDIGIVYAGDYPNKWEALKKAGYDPAKAIWVDDAPHFITQNVPLIGEGK